MLKKLRRKFVCINMAIVTVMLCVIFGTVLYFTQANLKADSLRMMESIAENPYQMGLPSGAGETRLPYFILRAGPGGAYIVTNGGNFDLSDEAFLRDLVTVVEAGGQTGTLEEYHLRYWREQTPGTLMIVFVDITSEYNTMQNLWRSCILIGLASFAVFLVLSILLARWAIRPVEQAWQQQRQFVADASHELKTPLTVILTNAELLQSPDCEEPARSRMADNILTMSRQMRGLVEDLLELARVDDGIARTVWTRVDLSRLVSDAVLPFEPVCFEAGLTLETDIQPDITVRGSESHLRQVAEILLDNARKYADPGGTVTVTLTRQGRRHCLLSVADPGEAISPEDLKNIFKRFYRVDKARAMDHSYGLGLSIADSIVTDHHGKIWAESAGGINTFFVSLPTAQP